MIGHRFNRVTVSPSSTIVLVENDHSAFQVSADTATAAVKLAFLTEQSRADAASQEAAVWIMRRMAGNGISVEQAEALIEAAEWEIQKPVDNRP
jgi:hypothetical protein